MAVNALTRPVPHSAGLDRPLHALPTNACDSHMHVFDPRFPASKHWKRVPPVADVDAYRLLQSRLGMERVVVVNPSTYGTDNTCTLDALNTLGDDARGVAVVDEAVSEAELHRLHSGKIRGLRVNFVTPQSWGVTTAEMLSTLASKAAPLGWHIQIFVHPEQLIALAPLLRTLPTPLVIDHMGLVDPAEGPSAMASVAIRRLLDRGNTWVKLSGVYMRSSVGAPSYADTLALGRRLVEAAPERMVWGSDWPHTTAAAGSINDADLLNVLHSCCESEDELSRILVDNPAKLYGFPATEANQPRR